jgi:nucleoside-diphosphate-sugar epimerase
MNVIITGAFGFLGSHVVKQCISFGFNPIVLERALSKREVLNDLNFISIKYNNLDDDALIETIKQYKPQSFIHIAWKGVDNSTRNYEEQITYNLPFSLQTIKFANNIGCKQWLGIGSLSEYGTITEKVNEKHLPVPLTIYAKAKLATCWASSALCQLYNLKWSWIRVGSIYGPGDADHWLIPYIINSLLNNIPPHLTPSEQVWDYLYVTDAANAILSIVQKQAEGIYNLGSGIEIKIKEVAEIIAEKLNSSVKPILGAKPYSVEQVMYMVADISKIAQTTGWNPSTIFSQGIDKTISSLLKQES